MASGSGFFKGEKKKKKKSDGSGGVLSIAPVFTPPTVVPKGKNKW